MRKLNFSAGPSCIPTQVLERLRDSTLEFEEEGLGIFELPHRSKRFEKCIEEVKDLFISLLNIPKTHEILFLSGGATMQFSMIPLNLSQENKTNYYLVSGYWSKAALKEAESMSALASNALSAGSSEDSAFKILPSIDTNLNDASYLHYTSNNTIFGTQFKDAPEVGEINLICDASSDILSRKISVDKHSLIYAGAQKNLGTPGVTIVIINRDLIRDNLKNVPLLLNYKTSLDSNSLYNTPPVSNIMVLREMLIWMKEIGGLSVIENANNEKAKALYSFLDSSSLYEPYAHPSARSNMNITFTLKDKSLDDSLMKHLEKENCLGIKGHRSVGGFRVSLYNAINISEVEKLIRVLEHYESNA